MRSQRTRLAAAIGAAGLLAILVLVAALAGGGSGPVPIAADDPCLELWNDDPLAGSDGIHAYNEHVYRDARVARVDRDSALVEGSGPPSATARCAVVFASPKVDFEPEFGVRVHDGKRWTGLFFSDDVPLAAIESLQRDATGTANARLLPDGRLTPR